MKLTTEQATIEITNTRGPGSVVIDVGRPNGDRAMRWSIDPSEARVIANMLDESAKLADRK